MMKIKLLIVTDDIDYGEHLSNVLSEKHADVFEVGICSSVEHLKGSLGERKTDILLIEPGFISHINPSLAHMIFVLFDGSMILPDNCKDLIKIHKYQRISSMVGNILENCAGINENISGIGSNKAHIVVVWSPHGGVGKTTVSLAYAIRKVMDGKNVVYLDLENFSSVGTYFSNNGKSISTVFDKLNSNLEIFLKGIRQKDNISGIEYFCGPENFEDINILTADEIEILVNACAFGIDELVVDLSSQCDEKIQKIFKIADKVLIVCDPTSTSSLKLEQFINQYSVLQTIKEKSVLVNNKGANIIEKDIDKVVSLPFVKSADPISVYKALSGNKFEW